MNEHRVVDVEGASVEVLLRTANADRAVVSFAHPSDTFVDGSVDLLAGVAGAPLACVNPHAALPGGDCPSLEAMVDRVEAVRRQLALGPWIFWGMSGGGWLAQIYAKRYPEALVAIVIESVGSCFRERLADEACVLSPRFPAWREGLLAAGLVGDAGADDGETEWMQVDGVGDVLRRRGGSALLVSPAPIGPELKRAMPAWLRFDSRPWLASITTPTLVLCGSADPLVPLHLARAVHDAITGSSFVVVDGAGHVPSSQAHPEVARAFGDFARRVGR